MRIRMLLLSLACLLAFSSTQAGIKPTDPNLGIIPAPLHVQRNAGFFKLNASTVLIAPDSMTLHDANMLNAYLKDSYGFQLEVHHTAGHYRSEILLAIDSVNQGKEAYRMEVTKKKLKVTGGQGAGVFYGIQSLIQMMHPAKDGAYEIPCAVIQDAPRFPYRGMHLDCGRHFFPVSFIKEYIDLMSRYKFNTFHWHLTEDQGWRLEIKKYPRLTEIGSQRSETVIGHNSKQYDHTPYGGYYTQDEAREIVAYAKARYVTVIPEIEMPGHALAALASYPLLGCTTGPYQVGTRWGVFSDVYCAGKESTFQFLENVLDEVMQIFPSHYIHIGGDECPKTRWKECPYCQKRMKDLGLTSEDQLQSYFVQRIEKYLNDHGRAIIGWDEILEGGLAPNATVMSWRGESGGIAAAKQHHNVIMTPGNWCYFDHGQGDPKEEPLNIGGYLPLSKVYGYNPVPAQLTPDERKYIIGVQANVWSEYIPSVSACEYMVLPRMLAMSEVAWSSLESKNYQNFLERLPAQLQYLDGKHIHFRIPEPEGLKNDTTSSSHLTVELKPYVPGTKMYYTLDGSAPTTGSALYASPIHLDLSGDHPVKLRLIEVTPSGNTSVPYEADYVKS